MSKIRRLIAPSVLAGIFLLSVQASAQGLVGAPVDPRYGQSNEVGQCVTTNPNVVTSEPTVTTSQVVDALISAVLSFIRIVN